MIRKSSLTCIKDSGNENSVDIRNVSLENSAAIHHRYTGYHNVILYDHYLFPNSLPEAAPWISVFIILKINNIP